MKKILVIGAQGTVGSALVPLLAAGGHEVRRATSRAPREAGQVHVDLVKGGGLSEALRGADAAFVLAPPGHVNQHELLGPVFDEARKQGVGKVVMMSAMGANADPEAPLRKAELHLEASGLPFNIVRPNWFMQNFNTFWLDGLRKHGRIFLPVGEAKGSFIDARDIAAVAARLLTTSKDDGQDFDLTGARALDHHEVAAILARETGRDIRYTEVTPEAMRDSLLGAGVPPAYAEFLLLILGFFKAGYSERTTDAVARITGREPIAFEQYARDYRQAWAA
jgi:uncharacterized protein YbjT (DUF2867 family)